MKKLLFLCLICLLTLPLLLITGHASELPAEGDVETLAPFASALADFFQANGGTLLTLLTLLASLLVALLYKAGLLPMLRAGLSALSDLLSKSTEITESFTKDASNIFARIEEQTKPALAATERCTQAIERLEEHVAGLENALAKSEKERRNTAAVLRTETELFYELLHSVNLPEAQKESMTESYYRLKRQMEGDE